MIVKKFQRTVAAVRKHPRERNPLPKSRSTQQQVSFAKILIPEVTPKEPAAM